MVGEKEPEEEEGGKLGEDGGGGRGKGEGEEGGKRRGRGGVGGRRGLPFSLSPALSWLWDMGQALETQFPHL